MAKKKKAFVYGDRVRVRVMGQGYHWKGRYHRTFVGMVYGEYVPGPGRMRRIYVERPDGCGVGYPVCFVTKIKP